MKLLFIHTPGNAMFKNAFYAIASATGYSWKAFGLFFVFEELLDGDEAFDSWELP